MPHMSSNLPSTIFYGSIFLEALCIARCTLRINDFIPRASDLFSRMMAQGWNRATIKKAFQSYSTAFQKFRKTNEEANNPGPAHGIQNENLIYVLPFHDCSFSGDGFYYNLNRYASIVAIIDTKLDETILSSKLEADGYNLTRLNRSRSGCGVACYIESSIACSYKDSFCRNIESIFVDIYLPKLPIFVTKTCFHRS